MIRNTFNTKLSTGTVTHVQLSQLNLKLKVRFTLKIETVLHSGKL